MSPKKLHQRYVAKYASDGNKKVQIHNRISPSNLKINQKLFRLLRKDEISIELILANFFSITFLLKFKVRILTLKHENRYVFSLSPYTEAYAEPNEISKIGPFVNLFPKSCILDV